MSICYEDEAKGSCTGQPFNCIDGPQDGVKGWGCRNGSDDDNCFLHSWGALRDDILWTDPNVVMEDGSPVFQEYRLVDRATGTYRYVGVVRK